MKEKRKKVPKEVGKVLVIWSNTQVIRAAQGEKEMETENSIRKMIDENFSNLVKILNPQI